MKGRADNMKKIYSELSRIQRELKVPKNLYNSFGNYKYRNAEGILEAVKPMLNGLALIINDEPVMIGARFYIKATVTLTDGEESVSATAYAREDEHKTKMDDCQLTGSCSSYARKYALNALLMIDDSKDSDDDSLSPKNPKNQEDQEDGQQPPPFTPPNAAQGTVQKTNRIPSTPPAPEPTEAQKYLLSAMKQLREDRGISASENNKLFAAQFKALVEAGMAPDKRKEEYTIEEAKALISAMYNNFPPTSAEMNKK